VADEQLLRELTERARTGGLKLIGNGGLLGKLTQRAGRLGVLAKTVKIWHHAGLITGHPYNDKGQCLYPPPGENPPTWAQGRKLSERRPRSSRTRRVSPPECRTPPLPSPP
jgi:hypothetical protein